MGITILSGREFNQDTGRAKKATADGPVFITDRGRPTHVLLSIEEYERITGTQRNIIDVLGEPAGVEDIDIEFSRSRDLPRSIFPDVSPGYQRCLGVAQSESW